MGVVRVGPLVIKGEVARLTSIYMNRGGRGMPSIIDGVVARLTIIYLSTSSGTLVVKWGVAT